jgi:hypothetical protein
LVALSVVSSAPKLFVEAVVLSSNDSSAEFSMVGSSFPHSAKGSAAADVEPTNVVVVTVGLEVLVVVGLDVLVVVVDEDVGTVQLICGSPQPEYCGEP